MAAEEVKKESQTPGAGADDGWDEARLQSALERLQEMHIQVRRLRDAIPSLVRPVHSTTSSSSPETLYSDFKTAATGSVDGVKRLRALLRDPDGREVLAHARAVKDKAGAGPVEGWLVEQHENWLDEPAVRSARELKTEEELEGNLSVPEPRKQEDIKGIVDAFKEAHPELEVKLLAVLNNILVKLPLPANINFTISWKPDARAEAAYEVSTKGPTKLHSSINQGLARRANKDDLNWTLELLADYLNIKQQRCNACNKLLDEDNGFATVKVAKPSGDGDGEGTQWDSYHVDCS